MTATYKLENIHQAIKLGIKLSRSWFRGHATVCNELTPKVFRKEFGVHRRFLGGLEQPIAEHFKRQAPVLSDHVPDDEDYVSWLFLMQHHGTPTRLLDWTTSPLMALYFCVSEQQEKDGELWAMYPEHLNKCSGMHGILLARSGIVRYLAEETSWKKRDELVKRCEIGKIPESPVAVYPPMRFLRMASQLSAFTIHPKPSPSQTIPELLPDERDLVRYIIPAASKRNLQDNLAALGITNRTLFPDLEGLSRTVVDEIRVLAYNPPVPPRWDEGGSEVKSPGKGRTSAANAGQL